MSRSFPETAIISISTHGEIRLTRDIASALFMIVPDMQMFYLHSK